MKQTPLWKEVAWWVAMLSVAAIFVWYVMPANAQESERAIIERINFEVNRAPPCPVQAQEGCHPMWPSWSELRTASGGLHCTGYAMMKAYLLEQAGIDPRRMLVMGFQTPMTKYAKGHGVLVIDRDLVLDNLEPVVRPFEQYERFEPKVLAPVPLR